VRAPSVEERGVAGVGIPEEGGLAAGRPGYWSGPCYFLLYEIVDRQQLTLSGRLSLHNRIGGEPLPELLSVAPLSPSTPFPSASLQRESGSPLKYGIVEVTCIN
jgi:hypothetical protein